MRFIKVFKPRSKAEVVLAMAVILSVLVATWQILALRGELDAQTLALRDSKEETLAMEIKAGQAEDAFRDAILEVRRLEGEVKKANGIIAEDAAEIRRLNKDLQEANHIIREQNSALREVENQQGGDLGITALISIGCLFLGVTC